MHNLINQDCYFALEETSEQSFVVVLCEASHWDEEGEIDSDFDLSYFDEDCDVSEFTDLGNARFEFLDTDLLHEDLMEELISRGFKYSVELQSHVNSLLDAESEEDNDFDEDQDLDEENDDVFTKYTDYSLN